MKPTNTERIKKLEKRIKKLEQERVVPVYPPIVVDNTPMPIKCPLCGGLNPSCSHIWV